MTKRDFPRIHFYNQDFVDVWDKTWAWIGDYWTNWGYPGAGREKLFVPPGSTMVTQEEAVCASFFLVYSNRIYHGFSTLDQFYQKQEPSGAIRWAYDLATGKPWLPPENPDGMGMPLFAWAEYNLYHRAGNKKRLKDVVDAIDRFTGWLDTFRDPCGLYHAPLAATGMWNAPRDGAVFLVDFNAAVAINCLYEGSLADILNDKDMAFRYKQRYFALKTRINKYMWDPETEFYYDVDKNMDRLPIKTLAGYWPMLAEIPNADQAAGMIEKLEDPKVFGSPHPFPSVAMDEDCFSPDGHAFLGSVYPQLNFMVIKSLEKYQRWDLARDFAIRHIYYVLDSLLGEGSFDEKFTGDLWEAYLPLKEGAALWPEADVPDDAQNLKNDPRSGNRRRYLPYVALSTIAITMENVLGITISLPHKTVDWTVPQFEVMGIENLALKKNIISIESVKANRGWEIHLESEKLYYFTIHIPGVKKKTLPIPSGKCAMLIDKI